MKIGQDTAWDPTATPTFWINHASRLLLRRFDERLRTLRFSMAYLRVATVLEEQGPLQQAALLPHVVIEQATLAALLTRMERDRFLVRRPDPEDARARLVSLTARGRSTLHKVQRILPTLADEALHGVSKRDRAKLMQTLKLVVCNLSEEAPD
ncbi:MAG TPA: MarR family transcriptional regulator [Pseudomonadota bacterium]|nr:MarR family transcriptional regulator [Pseudomonadota bacterium]